MLVSNQKVVGTVATGLVVRFLDKGTKLGVEAIGISWDKAQESRRSARSVDSSRIYVRREARIFVQRFLNDKSFESLLRIAAINGFVSDSWIDALQVADSLMIGRRLSGNWYGILEGDEKRFFSSRMKGERRTIHYLMRQAAKAGFLLKQANKNE